MIRFRLYIAMLVVTSVTVHAQEKVYSLNSYEFEAPKMEAVLDPAYRKLELNKDKHITISEPLVRSILNQGGIGKTVNIYGKALVIEEVNPLKDGSVELVMRKENGKSFFNFYPKVKARLVLAN